MCFFKAVILRLSLWKHFLRIILPEAAKLSECGNLVGSTKQDTGITGRLQRSLAEILTEVALVMD